MTPKEQLEILTAYVAGETIQYQAYHESKWRADSICGDNYEFNFQHLNYRKKPKPLECWMNWYPDGPGSPYARKEDALDAKRDYEEARTVHMREVVDDN